MYIIYSYTYIYMSIYSYILVQTLFPVRLLQNIEKSLCYTPGPCWLSILNMKNESASRSSRLFATPRTVAQQAPLSIAFCRQESWTG